MTIETLRSPNCVLLQELKGSVDFFVKFTNQDKNSPGYGLTVDSTKKPNIASIASTGFALSAWVIASERGFLTREQALELTRGTLITLLQNVPHHHGFFVHFLDIQTAARHRCCEYSTIDTALCLNGVITAAAYFQDPEISDLSQQLLERTDWQYLVFEDNGKTLFHMAYNPDCHGDYVHGDPGFISQWDMAAEQKMMYLQAAGQLDPELARRIYAGFERETGEFEGQPVIINPGGNLFAYHFTEAWLDCKHYLDPDGIDWFENSRLAALANRQFCIDHAHQYKTYHANSWGLSSGDCPRGYDVFGSTPCRGAYPHHNGTVHIYSAISCLPFITDQTLDLIRYLDQQQPRTWGPYGFYDAYNPDVDPPWYSQSYYGINKGCSMLMIENYLSGLIWNTYTQSPQVQHALQVLNFTHR